MRIFSLVRNIRNWPRYLSFKLMGKRGASFTFHCGQGIRLEVPLRLLHTFKESFLDEGYLRGFPRGFFQSEPVVLDIGANVGYFSFYLFSRFPNARIYAFEPVEKNFRQLQIYQASHPGFRLVAFPKAIAAQTGSITLYLDQGDSFTTSASIHRNPFGSDPVQVPSSSLRDIFREEGIDQVDLLKLDCEGAEYGILYSLPAIFYKKIKAITLETHRGENPGETREELAGFLETLGYYVRTDVSDLLWAWKKLESPLKNRSGFGKEHP